MTTLKDQIREDLDNVFFDTDEFAETVTWDGVDIDVIPASTEDMDWSSTNTDEHGALVQSRVYVVKSADFPVEPVPMQEVLVNDEAWYVEQVDPSAGSYTIKLERYQS